MMFLAVLTIVLNYYFLEHTSLGIVGVGLATAISLTLYNIVKIVFNYLKFKVHPLTIEMIFVSIISTLAITVAIVLPDFGNNLINLFYKPAVVLLLIYIGNHFLRIFPVEEYINRKFIRSIFRFGK
jgi:Na+-driven multidrug efflux pump